MRKFVRALPIFLFLGACVPGGIVPIEKQTPPNALGLGADVAPAVPQDWWAEFGDPQLNRLMTETLTGNPTLAQAMARLRAAKAGMEQANAALYPHADFNAQEQRLRLSGSYIYPPPYAGTDWWIGTVQSELSWNIDFWGKQSAALDKSKSLQAAARYDVDAAKLALSGAVTQAYIDLDRAYELTDVAVQTEKDRAATLSLTQRRVRDGLDSKVEEQEALALLAQAREDRVRAESQRDIVVHELAALMGRGADVYPTITRPSIHLDAALPLPQALPADLLARRPDVAAAEERVNAAVSGRAVAKAAFYPDVNLLASAGWASLGLSPLFKGVSEQYGGGAAVHLPIFDAGALRAQYTGATAELDGAIADYNGTLVSAVRDTSDALTRIHALYGERAQHQQMLAAAQKAYDLATTQYRTGLANQLTVLNAQNVLLQARQGDVSLAADSATQRVTLLVAVGGGFALQPSIPSNISPSNIPHGSTSHE